jgi:acetoin utilization protein AcuB
MTLAPVTVAVDSTVGEAHRLMRDRRIRHLPVVRGGQLVGIVSQRDVYLLETLKGFDPTTATVEDAMAADVYAVPPDARLEEVADEMARRRIGSAVVVERGEVVGLFTTMDALHALAALARGRGVVASARGPT